LVPDGVRPQVLEWLSPLAPDEPLAAYAARMAAPVPLNERCWVAGVSFGGIVALEIGRLRPLARIIQISSVSSAELLPLQFRLARATRLYRLSPPQALRWLPGVAKWFFGIQDMEMYALLRSFLDNMDVAYTRWAIHVLLNWDSRGVGQAIRLHGANDRVFPLGSREVE
jgi:pimeloyl-ACP methyl ester carboxylesterase